MDFKHLLEFLLFFIFPFFLAYLISGLIFRLVGLF